MNAKFYCQLAVAIFLPLVGAGGATADTYLDRPPSDADEVLLFLMAAPDVGSTESQGLRSKGLEARRLLAGEASGRQGNQPPAGSEFPEKGPIFSFPINFVPGRPEVAQESLPGLARVAEAIKRDTLRMLIEGHAEVPGNKAKSLMLSRERALAVANVLVDLYGVSSLSLHVAGRGDAAHPRSASGPGRDRIEFSEVR